MPHPLSKLLSSLSPADPAPDAELLWRFAATRDQPAFELLVRRHADLVWAVCRRTAGTHADAEDAFQAAFLALARKAGSVRGCVLGWLHRVAYHAALKVRQRSRRAGGVSPLCQPTATTLLLPWAGTGGLRPPLAESSDDFAVLYAELARLPDRYRLPVLLCDLEEKTHAAAAAELGWPVGTVSGRLSRARGLLRTRLTRRGITAATTLTAATAPPTLVRAAATLTGSPTAVALSYGAIHAMDATRRLTTAVLFSAAVGLGGGLWLTAGPAQEKLPAVAPPPAAKPADGRRYADPLQRVRSHEALLQVHGAIWAYFREHGHLPTDVLAADGTPLLSWRVAVLPYLGQANVYKLFKQDEPWDSPANKQAASVNLKSYVGGLTAPYQNPTGYGLTNVRRPTGPGTWHRPGEKVGGLDAAAKGAGMYSLLVVEAGPPTPWAKPDDIPVDLKNPTAIVGPFRNTLNALSVNKYANLRPDLTPAEVAGVVAADGRLTEATYNALCLDTPVDSPEAKAGADDARFLADRLARLRRLEIDLMTDEMDPKLAGKARMDRAALPAFLAAGLLKELTDVAGELRRHPGIERKPDRAAELKALMQELDKWAAERERNAK